MTRNVIRKEPSSLKAKAFQLLAGTLCVIAGGCAGSGSYEPPHGAIVYNGREINVPSDAIARRVEAERQQASYMHQQYYRPSYPGFSGGQQWLNINTSIDTGGDSFRTKGTYHQSGGYHTHSR